MSVWSLWCTANRSLGLGPSGWLAVKGVLDYAGGTVVHINAGIAGLASCLVLGKRVGYGKEAMPPHNLNLGRSSAPPCCGSAGSASTRAQAVAADGRAGMAMPPRK